MVKRKIVKIDEELCDGCGLCVPNCPEGALQIVEGKARLTSENYCDGLGACLGHCPKGAITIEEREAEPFDEEATRRHLQESGWESEAIAEHTLGETHDVLHIKPHPLEAGVGCPSAKVMQLRRPTEEGSSMEEPTSTPNRSELAHWPVKLSLVSPTAPFLKGADLLIAADCVPFAYADFHRDLLRGKAVIVGCPKLDDANFYVEKLAKIFRLSSVRSITVAHMEVPCCFGLKHIVQRALSVSGRGIPIREIIIGVRGEVKVDQREGVCHESV